MEDPFYGQILWVDRADLERYPRAYCACNGQLEAIMPYTALFSLLGTAFGGDGRQHFAVPDLRHVTAPGASSGPPRSGPPAGTSVPFVNAEGKLISIPIEKLAGAIPAPQPGAKDVRLRICLYGDFPQRG